MAKKKYVPIPAVITPKGENAAQKAKKVIERGFKTTLEKSGEALSGGMAGITADRIKARKKKNKGK